MIRILKYGCSGKAKGHYFVFWFGCNAQNYLSTAKLGVYTGEKEISLRIIL